MFSVSILPKQSHNSPLPCPEEHAILEDIICEFEHSEYFRSCRAGYLQSPRFILEDYLQEPGSQMEQFCPSALHFGLLVVLPARFLGLVAEDTHQIMREQYSFWAFIDSHGALPLGFECFSSLSANLLDKLVKILSLGESRSQKRVGLPAGNREPAPGEPWAWDDILPHEHDVYRLGAFSS